MTEAQAGSLMERLSFEEALAELEATVQKLEAGNLPLAEAIALYERGMALARCCGERLDGAELQIEQLSIANGQPPGLFE
jgi:exodeoxyribonuclease VII small subunit